MRTFRQTNVAQKRRRLEDAPLRLRAVLLKYRHNLTTESETTIQPENKIKPRPFMLRRENRSLLKQYGVPFTYTIGSSRRVTHAMRPASGCALFIRSMTSSIASTVGCPRA